MTAPSTDELRRIYDETKTIAVVGASADEIKPGHKIPAYLQRHGYRIVPVSPRGGEILGEPVVASLAGVDVPIDVVLVFRPPDEVPAIARDAVAAGAKVLWMQPGTGSDEAIAIALEGGLTAVSGRCMGVTHGELGLGPGPYA